MEGSKIRVDGIAGTNGLCLAISQSSSVKPYIVALTCRHVVIDYKTEGLELCHRQHSKIAREAIHINQTTYAASLELLQDDVSTDSAKAETKSDSGNQVVAAYYLFSGPSI